MIVRCANPNCRDPLSPDQADPDLWKDGLCPECGEWVYAARLAEDPPDWFYVGRTLFTGPLHSGPCGVCWSLDYQVSALNRHETILTCTTCNDVKLVRRKRAFEVIWPAGMAPE